MAKKMGITKNLGMLLLSIWLILTGLMQLVDFAIPSANIIMGLLALAAGVLILLGK